MLIWILLIIICLAELVLFILLLRFFDRLRKSEALLATLSGNQRDLMDKLRANAELERELMQSFAVRQASLQSLNASLGERAAELNSLLEQAQAISRSPQFLREVILSGKRKGRTSAQLAKATGLSLDEVELILAQAE
jgi:DNA-directed RNA polymerase specialized sigma24 family protein